MKIVSVVCLYTTVSPSLPEMEGIHYGGGGGDILSENVPFLEFMYLVFTRMPGGVTLADSGLCCCVPCVSSAIISLCSLTEPVNFEVFATDSRVQFCKAVTATDPSN